jgi:hypothetical protein
MRASMALTAAGRVVAGFERQAGRELAHRVGQRLLQDLGHGFGEAQQPGGLDADSLADQPAFRQHRAQPIGSLAVSTIDGGERGKGCGIHERTASKSLLLDWPRMISQADDGSRKEHDSFGEIEVPAGALWGAQTERARRNFQLSGTTLPADFIAALALIKAAAARANSRLKLLPADLAAAICEAALSGGARHPRRPVPARRLPDRQRYQHQHECQRGDRAPRGPGARQGRCTPTTT